MVVLLNYGALHLLVVGILIVREKLLVGVPHVLGVVADLVEVRPVCQTPDLTVVEALSRGPVDVVTHWTPRTLLAMDGHFL